MTRIKYERETKEALLLPLEISQTLVFHLCVFVWVNSVDLQESLHQISLHRTQSLANVLPKV